MKFPSFYDSILGKGIILENVHRLLIAKKPQVLNGSYVQILK